MWIILSLTIMSSTYFVLLFEDAKIRCSFGIPAFCRYENFMGNGLFCKDNFVGNGLFCKNNFVGNGKSCIFAP